MYHIRFDVRFVVRQRNSCGRRAAFCYSLLVCWARPPVPPSRVGVGGRKTCKHFFVFGRANPLFSHHEESSCDLCAMTPSPSVPLVAGTLQSDPRSGGIKKSSGVNVLPIVKESELQYRKTMFSNTT